MKNFFYFIFVILFISGFCYFYFFTIDGSDFRHIQFVPENRTPKVLPEIQTNIPILMYHYVRDVDEETDSLGWRLSISPKFFKEQIKWLNEQGYKTVHLSDLLDGKVYGKSVVLTFDDGLENFYTTALPILEKYNFTASNSVITGMIGNEGHMDLDQISKCLKMGIEITSHTVSHPDLIAIGEEDARREIAESRDYLEETFGIEVFEFVYPAGKYNKTIAEILSEEGYQIAVTTEYGEANLRGDLLSLPRIRIDNRDGFHGFVSKLENLGSLE